MDDTPIYPTIPGVGDLLPQDDPTLWRVRMTGGEVQVFPRLTADAAADIADARARPASPDVAAYKRIIDEYIEGVATSQEYDDATSFRSRAGYENAFQSAAIAFGQWSDAIYVWSSLQRENPPSTPPSLDEFRALLVSEFPIPDLAVMAPKKTSVLAWFKSWFQ